MSWHVPSEDEIDFVLEVFREIVEPTLGMLEDLVEDGISLSPAGARFRTKILEVTRDAVWRNDFCR